MLHVEQYLCTMIIKNFDFHRRPCGGHNPKHNEAEETKKEGSTDE